jgi:hypothetical protein
MVAVQRREFAWPTDWKRSQQDAFTMLNAAVNAIQPSPRMS